MPFFIIYSIIICFLIKVDYLCIITTTTKSFIMNFIESKTGNLEISEPTILGNIFVYGVEIEKDQNQNAIIIDANDFVKWLHESELISDFDLMIPNKNFGEIEILELDDNDQPVIHFDNFQGLASLDILNEENIIEYIESDNTKYIIDYPIKKIKQKQKQ